MHQGGQRPPFFFCTPTYTGGRAPPFPQTDKEPIDIKKITLILALLILCVFAFSALPVCRPSLAENMAAEEKEKAIEEDKAEEDEEEDEDDVSSREWLPEYDTLLAAALDMRNHYSYAPYSHYHVGAALLGKDGVIYTGCNVENASYPVGTCAERTAFVKAVSEGCREFSALVVVGASSAKKGSDFCAPCGMCRQAIREFCDPGFPIIMAQVDEDGKVQAYRIYRLDELLPDSFGPDNLS